ncbi:MAG TPA: type II secretion system protein GspN [Nitrospirota bacterium]|nr:type II secretion system protein GspN [Nitrospirota bacterium]
MIERKTLLRRLSFAAYFAAVFLLFLLLRFPFDRIKSKLESEVHQRTPLELSVAHISPWFFNRFVLSDVVVADNKGRILFESKSVKTTVSLFSLLRGALSLKLKAKAYGGELLVKANQGPGRQYLLLDADGLDIASYPLLKDFGLRVTGKLGGNFEMNGDSGKGRVWLKGLASRELTVRGFPIPDLDFEKGWLEAELKGDRLTVKKLELDGKDLMVRATGDLVLRERGMINLAIKLKPSERLAHEQSALISLLRNRDAEGYYLFSLGGLLSEPMARL